MWYISSGPFLHHFLVSGGGKKSVFAEDLSDARYLLCDTSVWFNHFLAVWSWESQFTCMNMLSHLLNEGENFVGQVTFDLQGSESQPTVACSKKGIDQFTLMESPGILASGMAVSRSLTCLYVCWHRIPPYWLYSWEGSFQRSKDDSLASPGWHHDNSAAPNEEEQFFPNNSRGKKPKMKLDWWVWVMSTLLNWSLWPGGWVILMVNVGVILTHWDWRTEAASLSTWERRRVDSQKIIPNSPKSYPPQPYLLSAWEAWARWYAVPGS